MCAAKARPPPWLNLCPARAPIYFGICVVDAVGRLRRLSPLWIPLSRLNRPRNGNGPSFLASRLVLMTGVEVESICLHSTDGGRPAFMPRLTRKALDHVSAP
jgi:hypothetical protein